METSKLKVGYSLYPRFSEKDYDREFEAWLYFYRAAFSRQALNSSFLSKLNYLEEANKKFEEYMEAKKIFCKECGAEAKIKKEKVEWPGWIGENQGDGFYPCCTKCCARGGYYRTETEAINAWR